VLGVCVRAALKEIATEQRPHFLGTGVQKDGLLHSVHSSQSFISLPQFPHLDNGTTKTRSL
jgi:hypothetical protein